MKPTRRIKTGLNITCAVIFGIFVTYGSFFLWSQFINACVSSSQVSLIEKIDKLEKAQRLMLEDINYLTILIHDVHRPQMIEMPFLPENVF